MSDEDIKAILDEGGSLIHYQRECSEEDGCEPEHIGLLDAEGNLVDWLC